MGSFIMNTNALLVNEILGRGTDPITSKKLFIS